MLSITNSLKNNDRTGGIAQVVEHLPSRCEALGLIPSTKKKEKDVGR
jgi:hypothetical protein